MGKNSDFCLPESIQEFSELLVFRENGFDGLDNNLVEPPMICDKSIKLDACEMAILSKGPKFAVREELVEENFKIELEKMICKRKYRSMDFEDDLAEFDPAEPLSKGPISV